MELSFEEELEKEVTNRLEQMQEPGYEFPKRMKKVDWIVAAIVAIAALVITECATLTAGVM